MFEVELKFPIADPDLFKQQIVDLGARSLPTQQHSDTYYNHPCRDFAETTEALRIRRCNGVPMVTYKGAKLPGAVKAREELEWRLDPGDVDGTQTERLLELLGFRRVGCVEKQRENYELRRERQAFSLTIDRVDGLGTFGEIELVVAQKDQITAAREQILKLAETLGLQRPEPRSYLRMWLERHADGS